ncbi:MAG: efflux RND transporter periplasmic adaptor subunit [Acidobacteria bacterium]|nr:efflux RND transporter periplasmic adaptor subunit [Acidobacteriota bacterium]
MKSSFRKTLLLAIVILMLLGAIAFWKALSARQPTNQIVLSGTIEADEIHIGSKVSGRIAAVLVKEGQEVQSGQALLRFESYDLEAKRQDANAAIAAAEANLQKLQNGFRPEEIAEAKAQAEAAWMTWEAARKGPRPQEIDAARADLEDANADYQMAKANFARIEQLAKDGISSRQDFDNAKANLDRTKGRRDAATQKLDLLLAGTRHEDIARAERLYQQAAAHKQMLERGSRKEDIATAQAQLERARAALQQLETQVNELAVQSPANAFIEVLRVRPGDLIAPNAPVATLVEVDRLWVRVYVPEPELGFAQLGKEVSVTVDSFPQERFKGVIEQVAARGEFTPRNVQTRDERTHQVFAVRVRLDNSSRKLRAGMAADVVIHK